MKCLKKVHVFLWLCLLPVIGLAQTAITGTVVDAAGEVIIGANVGEKGTRNSAVTDINGNFSLTVAGNAVLQVSFLGYATQDVSVTSAINGRLTITLVEDTKALDEVVVVGYGTQKKINLTGAVASVSTDELMNRPVVNLAEALQGLSPGLVIEQ
jgi:hypothetical protein